MLVTFPLDSRLWNVGGRREEDSHKLCCSVQRHDDDRDEKRFPTPNIKIENPSVSTGPTDKFFPERGNNTPPKDFN
jgi:hypothetical protein